MFKRILTLYILTAFMNLNVLCKNKTVCLRIIQTTDVHGSFFPYDFINRHPDKGSLARVYSYVDSLRHIYGDNLILLDNGDILQGQPTCYYFNFLKPQIENLASTAMNFMRYDACTIGNHDVEAGHDVFDKWRHELHCPMLAANVLKTDDKVPYFLPYTILNRGGIKVAVLGMLTAAVPNWLEQRQYQGMMFENMVKSSRKWIKHIKETEHPDIIIGLFHSGKSGGITTEEYEENASLKVAEEVDGFDLILFGHDHTRFEATITNKSGHQVVCLDASSRARLVADATIELVVDENVKNGKECCNVLHKRINGKLVDITSCTISDAYMQSLCSQYNEVQEFVDKEIGCFDSPMTTRDAFFGNSSFIDFIHNIQIKVTNADISFNAPLATDAHIDKGKLCIADLFKLYKYENKLYAIKMTGKEIKDYLEMSYGQWVNTMKDENDHIILMNYDENLKKYNFQNLTFNFDSACGIDYTVDVSQPTGQRVNIRKLSNGNDFVYEDTYIVAMNSYRGNGGGELLTKGAGIAKEDLKNRIVFESENDMRYYIMNEIETLKMIHPKANDNWKFVPEKCVQKAIVRDRYLLFKDKIQ
ncbi:MAG: bifunctional metallophosphatase/5'-nucleotidase [Prevotella sp.]